MCFNLKLELTGGEMIERCCKEAIRISKLLNIVVEFDFNGVTALASPNGNANALEKNILEVMNSERQYKFANSYNKEKP